MCTCSVRVSLQLKYVATTMILLMQNNVDEISSTMFDCCVE